MTRAWFLGLLICALFVAGLVMLRGAELALLIPLLLYWGYGLWQSAESVQLQVERHLSAAQAGPGMPVEVTVTVKNLGDRLDEVALLDAVPHGLEVIEGSNTHLVNLARLASFGFTYRVRGPRGGYSFGDLLADAGDTFGLLRRTAVAAAPARLVVLPRVSGVKAVPIRPRRTRVYAGAIPARVGGTGLEFFGLRPYAEGDPARRLNWRAMARHPEAVYSNQFQQERVADVAVVLDGRDRTNVKSADGSLFEHSVIAAGSLAGALLQQGNRVGLLLYSHFLQWTMPGYGKVQRERILHSLAVAAPGASQVFEGLQYLPTRLFPPESQIVLISPLLEDDMATLIQLRARGYQVLVICPDPVSFENRGLLNRPAHSPRDDILLAARVVRLERVVMLGRLRRAGVHALEWDTARPFDESMRSAFRPAHRTSGAAMTRIALVACILLGGVSLAWGYKGMGLTQLSVWVAAAAAFWLIAVWRRWQWFSYIGVTLYFLAAALGLWFLNFPPGWMFGGAVMGLLAWDLMHFGYRLRFAADGEERRRIELRHLVRVAVLGMLGLTFSSLAMILQLQLTFDWIVFMAIVVALGLAQIIRWFRTRP